MLGPRHRFGQRIFNVVVGVHLAHPHVFSINIMSDHVVLPLDVSESGARARFPSLRNNDIIVTIDVNCFRSARNNT